MTDLAKLVVKLEAETGKYRNELEKSNKRLSRFARKQELEAAKAGKAIAAGLTVATGALVLMLRQTINTADGLQKLSDRLGAPVESLSQLRFAAERTGVASNKLDIGLQRMERRIAEVASTGRGEALPALNELGLSAEKLSELTIDKQFLVVADALQGVEDPADKVRLGFKLLDSEGVALLQTMKDGSQGIIDLAKESDALGNTISSNTAKQAAALKDELTNVQARANGLAQEMFVNLGPSFINIANSAVAALPALGDFGKALFEVLNGSEVAGANRGLTIANGKIKDLRADLAQIESPATTLAGKAKGFFTTPAQLAEERRLILQELNTQVELASIYQTKLDDLTISATRARAEKVQEISGGVSNVEIKLSDFQGTNTASSEVDRVSNENAKIISLQERKFATLRQLAIEADLSEQGIAQLRYERSLTALAEEETRLRERNLLTEDLAAGFRQAEQDALTLHEDKLTKITERGEAARRQVRIAGLQVAGDLVGALGAVFAEQSKEQRAAFAVEKSIALARAGVNLQAAIADRNTVKFPGNFFAIAEATATGLGAIAALKKINISGGREYGGRVTGGQYYEVGERGPEIFQAPAGGGRIIPNGAGAGGGITVNLIESTERAGEVEQGVDDTTVDVYVARIRGELTNDVLTGRGIAQALESTYNVKRAGGF